MGLILGLVAVVDFLGVLFLMKEFVFLGRLVFGFFSSEFVTFFYWKVERGREGKKEELLIHFESFLYFTQSTSTELPTNFRSILLHLSFSKSHLNYPRSTTKP